ncbi:MAG: hypothetical protein RIQ33_569 [Bacteroidota bacterium]|jgi:molecular chaperone DnaK
MLAIKYGIDLGTTNSLIAKFENGKVSVLKNPNGFKETLPSVVAFKNNRIIVGDKARELLQKDALHVFGGFKRKMGTDEKFYVVGLDENVTPLQLSGYVLKELQNFIQSNDVCKAAVITIPASFNTVQSSATKKAGEEAGLDTVYLLQEPIAASLAYFNNLNENTATGSWLVYDLGGGTFDVALVSTQNGALKIIDHEGNNYLGGMDFDQAIVDKIILPKIIEQTGYKPLEEEIKIKYGKYEKLNFYLLYLAEEVKKTLSNQSDADIEFSAEIDFKNHDFYFTISQAEFNHIIQPFVTDTINFIHSILSRNNIDSSTIQQIILVGGSTYIPYIRTELLHQTGIAVNTSIDPTTAVVVGAAYYSANKYYEPSDSEMFINNDGEIINYKSTTNLDLNPYSTTKIIASYNKTTNDIEEVLIVKIEGNYENLFYRITRNDGGFDSGLVKANSKFTEFLILQAKVANQFTLKIFDEKNNEIVPLQQQIEITNGLFSIDGQPLPKDICIEIDDAENHTTKLQAVFERNSILPQKKNVYKEISRTITKGSSEAIVINILEGDRNARAISNLPIGVIEIKGKDLTSDLLKGSDIEIQMYISESRELTVEVLLVMTNQKFKNVFSISESTINIDRLKEQYQFLENELHDALREMEINEDDVWSIQTDALLTQLKVHKNDLDKLKATDNSDKKYYIAETIRNISQEFDKIGGNDRLHQLQREYFELKDFVDETIKNIDHGKDAIIKRYSQLQRNEVMILKVKNPSIIKNYTAQLNELSWDILYHTNSFLIRKFFEFKEYEPNQFKNYNAVKILIQQAEKALEAERLVDFKEHVHTIAKLRVVYFENQKAKDFKGTGIG